LQSVDRPGVGKRITATCVRSVPFVTARFGLSCANGSEIGFSNQIDRPFVLELGEIEDRRNESEK